MNPPSQGVAGQPGTSAPVTPSHDPAAHFLREIWQAVQGDPVHLRHLAYSAAGALPSVFAVTDLASAAIGAASLAIAELVALHAGRMPAVQVDRRLASFWFGTTLRPQGWTLPPQWDAVAGDYAAADGWIRLHTNAPHHRAAALTVLGTPPEREAVARAVATWRADELESAIVAQHGCAAAMRSLQAWRVHPQGQAVCAEPLLHHSAAQRTATPAWAPTPERPLQGMRVLDLTRVLAGPVATRFLAGFGATVLRIDPPDWDEPSIVPEVVLGKRCARLDLRRAEARATLERLLAEADVMIHGYRPDALARLGLDAERRRALNPRLVDVSLDAYGWSGPWRGRRGFDSLVQMSSGVADAGMRAAGLERPQPLPVQALDHATGYLMACAAVRGLTQRLSTGEVGTVRASLARTAQLLIEGGQTPEPGAPLAPEQADDLDARGEATAWGAAQRLKAPAWVEGAPMYWDYPATSLGSSAAAW